MTRVGLVRVLDRDESPGRARSDGALAEVGLAHANLLLGWQLGDSDVIDDKASTLLTADIAAGSILVVAHKTAGAYWAIPAILFVVAGAFFYGAIRARTYDYGEDIRDFRRKQAGKLPIEIIEAMLAEIIYARELNQPGIRRKTRAFKWGYRTLAVAALTAISLALAGGPGNHSQPPKQKAETMVPLARSRSTRIGVVMAAPRPLPAPSQGGRIKETRGKG